MTRSGAFWACTTAAVTAIAASVRNVLPTPPTLLTLPTLPPVLPRGPHKLPHGSKNIRPVDVALRVHRHPFGERGAAGVGIRTRVGDERLHRAVAGAADADAAACAGVHAVAGARQAEDAGVRAAVARLGVGHVDGVVLV